MTTIKKFVDSLFSENSSNENLDEANKYFQLAIKYYHQKNWAEAEQHFEKAIALDPHNLDIPYNFAVMTYEKALETKDQDTMQLAATRYERLLSSAQNDVEALVNLAVIYMNNDFLGKFDQAKKLLEHAIDINPDYALAWLNLGQFYSFRGGGKSLISATDKIIQSKLEGADAKFNLKDLKRAINYFDHAFKLDSSLSLKFNGLKYGTERMIKMIESES